MTRSNSMFRAVCALLSTIALCVASVDAQEINTSSLSENGWFSDDTRADGSGTESSGTNLISNTLTDDPEAGISGTLAHDVAINGQIIFGDALGAEPALTHGGAVHLVIDGGGSGKSQISHRKDDITGHGPGSGFGPGFTAAYSWMGDGTVSVTASLKFGIKTADFGSTGVSSRTGENVWDKVLIYEPGNLNGGLSDGTWYSETIDYTTGKWWFFDRTVGASTIGSPKTLSAMSVSLVTFSGSKTIKDVYDLITAPGAVITSVQFGIGSGNAGGSVYANQMVTSVYRAGMTTTFGQPSPFDQDVTPEVIFGSGNANGGFTVDRQNGVELGLRAKVRFPVPMNVFNSNGDGTYTFPAGAGIPATLKPTWSFEWSANTDYDGSTGSFIDDLTYELGIDYDSTAGTNYLVFDPISIGSIIPWTPPAPPAAYWDHSIGDNSTANGAGTEATDGPTYAALVAANNVVQNSWRMDFFNIFPFDIFDPTVSGRYEFYLAASSGGSEVARTSITVLVMNGATLSLEAATLQTDQDAGTAGVQIAAELWLRNPDDVEVTGFQAFLDFDDLAMTYEGAISSYTATPFETHIQSAATANVAAGQLRLDGSTFSVPGPTGDALLATMFFTVTECDLNSVAFDLTQAFASELSVGGSPIVTDLLDSPAVAADDTAPVLTPCPADITQSADAGSCTDAVVSWTDPTATDNCDPSPTVVSSPASGSTFPVGTTLVTCTATDATGNVSTCTFNVTVTATNDVDVIVHLVGSDAASRCIHFQLDNCATVADTTLTFVGTAPAVAVATIKVPCGVWTKICAKDQQHTQWAESPLTLVGAKYVATLTLALDGGDTDDDGDVDINDVTLFLAQFGSVAAAGGCPYDGITRDADFSNNGAIGSEDYPFLTANWLTTSACSCALVVGGEDPPRLVQAIRVHNAMTAAADLNEDGVVNVRDVELFELRHFLSGELSQRMRATQR